MACWEAWWTMCHYCRKSGAGGQTSDILGTSASDSSLNGWVSVGVYAYFQPVSSWLLFHSSAATPAPAFCKNPSTNPMSRSLRVFLFKECPAGSVKTFHNGLLRSPWGVVECIVIDCWMCPKELLMHGLDRLWAHFECIHRNLCWCLGP